MFFFAYQYIFAIDINHINFPIQSNLCTRSSSISQCFTNKYSIINFISFIFYFELLQTLRTIHLGQNKIDREGVRCLASALLTNRVSTSPSHGYLILHLDTDIAGFMVQ